MVDVVIGWFEIVSSFRISLIISSQINVGDVDYSSDRTCRAEALQPDRELI